MYGPYRRTSTGVYGFQGMVKKMSEKMALKIRMMRPVQEGAPGSLSVIIPLKGIDEHPKIRELKNKGYFITGAVVVI
jgi:hypothetical protein